MTTSGETDSIYVLNDGSSEAEHERLNLQHRLFDDIMQNTLLPPHIHSSITETSKAPKVLDLATGTGIWLTSVAKTLPPDSELVGLDFDTSKFPPAGSLPPNITLSKGNIFEPFPADLHGRFDVVNVRLILLALKVGDGTALMKNVMSLLKPGGFVVWSETGPTVQAVEPPSFAFYKFQDIHWRYAKQFGGDLNLPLGMVAYIKEAGYTECGDRAYPGGSQLYTRQDWLERSHRQVMTFIPQTLRGIVSLGGVEGMETKEQVDELVAELRKDFVGDRKVHPLFMRAWGKKPEAS
ncbi:hypothetical protein F5Y18DRAFT_433251 [Xylariaceae sp. FL1019]|nr:hypothetical protein F5Y18DRAFT_433251 [Xylariaceae sp. FL1019]